MVSIRAQTEFNCARGGRGGVVGRKTRQERANLQKNGFAGMGQMACTGRRAYHNVEQEVLFGVCSHAM